MDELIQAEPGMASKARYRITVKGRVDAHWREWFNGSEISIAYSKGKSPKTILTCSVKDQAELLGILTHLNTLNLPLLDVALLHTPK